MKLAESKSYSLSLCNACMLFIHQVDEAAKNISTGRRKKRKTKYKQQMKKGKSKPNSFQVSNFVKIKVEKVDKNHLQRGYF